MKKKSNLESLLMEVFNENIDEDLDEATIRSNRRYYGVTNFGKEAQADFGGELIKAYSTNSMLLNQLPIEISSLIPKRGVESPDFGKKLISFIATNLKNKMVLCNPDADVEPANTAKLQLLILPKEWTGSDIKKANSKFATIPSYFTVKGGAVIISSKEYAVNKAGKGKELAWTVSKAEELTAELSTLDSFRKTSGLSKKNKEPKNVVIWSSTGELYHTFENVADVVKSEIKTDHADFYLVDTAGDIISGTGISHKAKAFPDSNRGMAERYAGIVGMMNSYANSIGNMQLQESSAVSSTTYETIKDFVEKSEAYFKLIYLNAGVKNPNKPPTIAGFYQTIESNEAMEDMIYGPEEEPGCDIIVVSTTTGMSLKPLSKEKAGPIIPPDTESENIYSISDEEQIGDNWFELDPGPGGYIFIRPEIPDEVHFPDLFPILMCRFGSKGSKIYFSDEEAVALKAIYGKNDIPKVGIDNKGYFIGARYYLAPFIRKPTAVNITDLDTTSINIELQSVIKNHQRYVSPAGWQLTKESCSIDKLLKYLL